MFYPLFSLLIGLCLSQSLYNYQRSNAYNATWMSNLDNGIPIREMSIIGSHSSMGTGTGGWAFKTQSNPLMNQMMIGMRALDIRCRHYHNGFSVHDRFVYLNTDLQGVLDTVRSFLSSYPMETILMHIVEEYDASGNSQSFEDTYLSYQASNSDLIWTPTSQNPVLGEVRGKIVIIQDFRASGIHGLLYTTFTVLPHKYFNTNWDQYDKWTAVKNFLGTTNSAGKSRISFWTGHGGSFPYFVASGKSSPGNGDPRLSTALTTPGFRRWYPDFPRVACFIGICTIAFEGINILAYNYLNDQGYTYLGIVFTDFVGQNIIAKSISFNSGKFTPCPSALLDQGCTYCNNAGQCLGCNATQHYIYNPPTKTCLASIGYYLEWISGSNNSAVLCSEPMPGCLECSSVSVCTKCDVLAHYQLINSSCLAAPYYYLDNYSIPVTCTLTGCYRCESDTLCTECSAPNNYIITGTQQCQCDSGGLFVQHPSADACICQTGYFISSNNTCQLMPLCPSNNSGCALCSSGPVYSCITCDASGFFQTDANNPALCACISGFYYDGISCQPCNTSLSQSCSSCASETLCLSCGTNFTLSNGDCQCLPQYYQADPSTCLSCAPGCLLCIDGVACIACDIDNNFTSISGVCECIVGMFLNDTVCQVCGSMPGCLDCTNDGCIDCDPIFGFSLNATTAECECDYGYFINNMSVCQACTELGCRGCNSQTQCTECNQFFWLNSSSVCQEVCGDGVLYVLECDDNNTSNGDGCDENCRVEADYTCVGGTTLTQSECSYSGDLNITVLSIIKDPKTNTVYMEASISPALNELGNLDFNTVWVPNFPVASSTTSYNSSTGRISMTFTYDQSLNDRDLSVDLVPPATPEYFYMKVSTTYLPDNTDNNLALKAYSTQVYDLAEKGDYMVWTVALLAVGMFLLCCLLVSKLMGLEMIFIFQVGYAGLLLVTKQQALMVPLRHLKIVNGYNQLMSDSSSGNIPQRLQEIYYSASFLANFAFGVIMVLLPLIIGSTVLLVAKLKQQKGWRLNAYRILKQWQFCALLFVQIHLAVSVCLSLTYDDQMIVGMAFGGLIYAGLIAYIFLLKCSPKNFGEFKSFFKEGTLNSHWYIIVILLRTIIGFLLGYMWQSKMCGYAVVGVSGLWMAFGAAIRPYQSNLRPVINSLFVFALLGLYTYCNEMQNSSEVTFLTTYMPLIIIGLLFVALAFNAVCIVLYKCGGGNKNTGKNQSDQSLLENETTERALDKQYIQNIKEQLKGAITIQNAESFDTPKRGTARMAQPSFWMEMPSAHEHIPEGAFEQDQNEQAYPEIQILPDVSQRL